MAKSGLPMPPVEVPSGSSAGVIENAAKTSRDGWNRFGNHSAEQALAFDKNTVRKPLNPKTVAAPTKGDVKK